MVTRGIALAATVCLVMSVNAQAQTTKPASEDVKTEAAVVAAPVAAPAAAPVTAPVAVPVFEAKPKVERNIRFQFDGIPYAQVIRMFSQMAKRPVLGDVNIDGTLTFFDSQPYSYDEALDTLNLILEMRGYAVKESGRFLRVMPLTDVSSSSRIIKGLDDSGNARPGEIVTMVLPVKHVDSAEASKAVVRMVSTFGAIAPLGSGKGIVITDRLENIKRVQGFIKMLDTETMEEQKIRTYKLTHASAQSVAETIANLFGPGKAPRGVIYNSERKRYVQAPENLKDVITATFDERTNTVMLIGGSDRIKMAEDIIKTFDDATGGQAGDFRIFELKNARAEEISRTILAALPSKQVGIDPRTKRPIMSRQATVVADSASNRLIVSAPANQMAAVEKLTRELDDASTSTAGARVFALKVASAQQLAGIITNAVVTIDARGQRRSKISVAADMRTNSLIVAGSPADIKTASTLIEELDAKGDVEAREIHVVQLEMGDARQLAPAILRLFSQQAGAPRGRRGAGRTQSSNLRVEADQGTNSLMIACFPDDWPMIQDILKQLKTSTDSIATASTSLIPLKFAKAADMVATLKQVFAAQAKSRGRRPRGPGVSRVPVVIASVPQSNSLLISAAADDQEAIAALVKSMDVEPTGDVEPVQIFRLTSADAAKLAATLTGMLPATARGKEPKVFIQADAATNSVLIRAPQAERKMIETLITSLDEDTGRNAREIHVVALKHASAAAVSTALNQLYRQPGPSPKGRRGAPRIDDQADRVTITPAPGDRAVIIDAPRKKIREIVELTASLDSKDALGRLQIRTYRLTGGNAVELAKSLAALFVPKTGKTGKTGKTAGGAPQAQARFEADRVGNQLLIAATEAQFEQIEATIKELSGDALTIKTETFELKFAKASEVAPVLQTMLGGHVPAPPKGKGKPAAASSNSVVRVAAMVSANSVIVQGPTDRLELARQLISTLDTETVSKREVRLYKLVSSSAADVAKSLARIYVSGTGKTRVAGQVDPRFEADRGSNQLIISATADQFVEIEKLVKELQAKTVLAIQTRTFKLQFARASDIVKMLEPMLGKKSSNVPYWYRGSQGQTEAVQIAAMETSNSVVIQGPPEKIALADELIKTFDTDAGGKVTIEIVRLKNADARTLADSIKNTLEGRQAGRRQWWEPQKQKTGVVTLTSEPNSNSILVRGPSGELPTVIAMIKKLDAEATSVIASVKTFPITNGEASDLAKSLSQLFTDITRQQGRQRRDTPVPPFSVTADTRTNSLVVSTTSAYFALVEELLASLDKVSERPLRQAQYVWLDNASAIDVALKINAMYEGQRGTDKPVVEADYYSNALTIIAKNDQLNEIQKLIKDLDKAAEDRSVHVRVIPLTKSKAENMADVLRRVYGQMTTSKVVVTDRVPALLRKDAGQQLLPSPAIGSDGGQAAPTTAPAGGGATPAAQQDQSIVTIAVDKAANALIISGTRNELAELESLVEQLSTSEMEAEAKFYIVKIKKADPESVASTLNALFNPRRQARPARQSQQQGRRQSARRQQPAQTPLPTISVVADQRTRSIIIRAKPIDFELITPLIKHLDEVSTVVSEVRVFTVKNVDSAAVAANLRELFSLASGGGQTTARAARGRRATAQQQRVEQVRNVIEIRGKNGVAQVDVSSMISITANKDSNSVIVAAPSDAMTLVEKIIEELDQASQATVPGVYILPLTNGDAVAVSAMVRNLYQEQSRAARTAKRAIAPLAVSADERANAIVLATTKEMYDQVLEWVQQIEKMKPARGTLKLIILEHADPEDVDKAIQQLFNGGSSAAPRGRQTRRGRRAQTSAGSSGGKVQTTVLPSQRAIMITASDDDFATIAAMAADLDVAAAGTKREVKVFQLVNASNQRVAQALTRVYRAQGRGARPEDQVTVQAIQQTSTLIVTATKDKMEEVSHLVAQLDQKEVSPAVEFRIYPLIHATPGKVLPVLRQMLAQVRRTLPGETINVQADERTRSVIVTARSAVFDQIGKIIETLDKPPANQKTDVLIIPLKRADAARLANVLNEMLRPSAANQVTPEARALQEQVRILRVQSTLSERIPELDLTLPIKISADPARPQGSNSLIVSSTPDNLLAMRAIVELMDTVPLAENVDVKILHLKNADATSVMQVLKDIFNQGSRLAGRPGTTAAGKSEPDSVSGKALVNPLNVSADVRTNTLVLAGMTETLVLADLVAKDLDREDGKLQTQVKLFRLKHADVVRLMPVLRAVFTQGAADPGAEGLRTHVTRLQTVLAAKTGHTTDLAKTFPVLTIQADASTNILVVAARKDVMPLISDVISTMDVPGAGSLNTVRIFPMINADVSRMSQMINSLYTGPNASLVRNEDKPTVAIDTRTNSLVISASEKTFAMLDVLLERMDTETPVELLDIRLVTLANAEAATMAPVLQKMMDARVQRQASLGVGQAEALRMVIVADERSNSLIVGGSNEGYQIIKGLAEKLDGASPALGGKIQLIGLVHANAGTMVATLGNLFTQRYQAARTADVQRQKPIILPDLRTNSLLVAANADDSAILKSLLKNLDVELLDPAVQLVVLPLRFNDAGTVGTTIQQIFQARLTSMTPPGVTPAPQDRVDVATDALTNALVISASKENLSLIQALLAKVDIEPPTDTGIVRMYPLLNSDAQRVSTMLKGLISEGLYKPGIVAAAGGSVTAAREKVAIAVDVRTNVLIVSASKENFAVIEQVLRQIDSGADFGALGDMRMYPLTNADSTRLAPILQQLFDAKLAAEQAAGGAGRALKVSIIPDPRTNTLLVAGSRESFNALALMIKTLDGGQIAAASEFRIFVLEQATATAMRVTLETLFAQRIARGGTKDPVSVIADPRINALIVGGSPADMKLAASLIIRLDEAAQQAGETTSVFPLKKADAKQVATIIQSLYQTPGASGGASVTITSDERINAIVATAGRADVRRIGELVKQLDRDKVARVTEIRVFPLNNADATELATVLTDIFNNKPKELTGGSANRQTILQFVTQTKDGQKLIASALQEGVIITADKRSNALVVSAPLENIPLLASLITSLDTTSPRKAEIRVFTLTNADATRMADVLKELFRLQGTGAAGTNPRAISYKLVTSKPGTGADTSVTMGSDEQNALTITVDSRTNSLLVGGTRQYIDLVSEVITSLDASPAQERMVDVYHPRNAKPVDIATALRSFLDQERTRVTSALGANNMGAAQRLLEREVAVVAEEKSGSLLLSASPRYFEVLMKMIKELDKAPPQVLIQVMLAEVKLDDTTDLGIDWSHSSTHSGVGIAGGTNYGVGAAIQSFTGLNLAVTGSDLSFFLRALKNQGRLEVLSRPQILASDNQEASINVGQRVPLITASQLTDQGNTNNTIDYKDVGIKLRVTPRINPDGFIRLEVNPEISSLSTSSVDFGTGTTAPIINNRSAKTTVTVRDGHTIVIGGLITTSDETRVRKVPFLGDIPLLGGLFRSTTISKERTELLIILTPRIMTTPEQSDKLTDEQLRRLKLLRGIGNGKNKDSAGAYLMDELKPSDERRLRKLLSEKIAGNPTTRPMSKPAMEHAK